MIWPVPHKKISQILRGTAILGEQCDDGNTENEDHCRNDCTWPRCGDGIVDQPPFGSEQCDDGNMVDHEDECRNNCKYSTRN